MTILISIGFYTAWISFLVWFSLVGNLRRSKISESFFFFPTCNLVSLSVKETYTEEKTYNRNMQQLFLLDFPSLEKKTVKASFISTAINSPNQPDKTSFFLDDFFAKKNYSSFHCRDLTSFIITF